MIILDSYEKNYLLKNMERLQRLLKSLILIQSPRTIMQKYMKLEWIDANIIRALN